MDCKSDFLSYQSPVSFQQRYAQQQRSYLEGHYQQYYCHVNYEQPDHASAYINDRMQHQDQLTYYRKEDIVLQRKIVDKSFSFYENNLYPISNTDQNHGGYAKEDSLIPDVEEASTYFRMKQNNAKSGGIKCRKPRTVFSDLQLMVLEREFNNRKYLSTPQRKKLADRLGLNQTQVKTWYQNRRMKWKKETFESEDKEPKKS